MEYIPLQTQLLSAFNRAVNCLSTLGPGDHRHTDTNLIGSDSLTMDGLERYVGALKEIFDYFMRKVNHKELFPCKSRADTPRGLVPIF